MYRYILKFAGMLPEMVYQALHKGRQILKNHIQNLPTLIPKRVCPFCWSHKPFLLQDTTIMPSAVYLFHKCWAAQFFKCRVSFWA